MSQAASRPASAPPQAPPTPALAAPGRTLARHAPALLAAAGGLAFIVLHVGWSFLDPTRVGWTLHRDWAAGQIGWSFFRSAPWGFPLGASPAYPYGIGSTVGFADGLPLLAVALKPLAGLLPVDFQYLGPWIALCFAAQGFAGAKLTALTTPSRLAQALGGLLFACSPVLLHRLLDDHVGHSALGGQALLLTLLWLAAPGSHRGTFSLAPRGECSVAPTPRSAQSPPPRGPPRAVAPLRHLVCPAAAAPALVLLTPAPAGGARGSSNTADRAPASAAAPRSPRPPRRGCGRCSRGL